MEDFAKIIGDSKPTLVDFFATWCGPCRMQAPVLEQVKQTLGDSVNIIKVDIDKNSEAASQYRVMSVPTLMIFKDGAQMWRASGLHQADVLVAKLREYIG